jgi:hypothetical protein
MELPCVVIGYRTRGRELRDLVMASLVGGKPVYVGVVELGVRQELLGRLEGIRRAPLLYPLHWWLAG